MSQYQPNVASGRSFISKINLKFSGLSLSTPSFSEKDGSNAESTLIHNAFVSYFDAHNQPYPEWLGATNVQKQRSQSSSQSLGHQQQYQSSGSSSQYQPVRASYNSVNLAPVMLSPNESHDSTERPVLGGYTRRGSSRLQEMYNKTRQSVGSASGSGYTPSSSGYSASSSGNAPSAAPSASRSSSLSNRLRDRLMNGSGDSSLDMGKFDSTRAYDSGSRATWGRN